MNFYERQFLQAWEEIHYPPGPEVSEEPMMEPVQVAQAGGGAAFGVFPAMKSRASRTGEISPAAQMMVPDVAAGATKGLVTGGVGMPGDIESLIRGIRGIFTRGGDQGKLDAFLQGMEEKTILPTSEDVSKWLDTNVGPVVPAGAPMAEQRAGVAKAGQFAGEMVSGPGTLVKGAKAGAKATAATAKFVAPKVGEMLSDYMRRSGMTPELMAYHGTPARFEKFDASKIGTGEGAQAYGYGLYFAESKDVAGGYAVNLANRDMTNQGRLNAHANAQRLVNLAGDPKYAADDLKFVLESQPDHPQKKLLTETLQMLESGDYAKPLKTKGSLYTVDISDEMVGRMLDWDKPLDKQPEIYDRIKPLLDPMARAYGTGPLATKAGDQLTRLGREMGQEKLSERLRELGIPGIKYLDQSSRTDGKGTRNIVVFPGGEDQVKILKVE